MSRKKEGSGLLNGWTRMMVSPMRSGPRESNSALILVTPQGLRGISDFDGDKFKQLTVTIGSVVFKGSRE